MDLSVKEIEFVTEVFTDSLDDVEAVKNFIAESAARTIRRKVTTSGNTETAIRTLRDEAHKQELLGEVLVDLANKFPKKRQRILSVATHIQSKYKVAKNAYRSRLDELLVETGENNLVEFDRESLEEATSVDPFIELRELGQWCDHAEQRICRVRCNGDDRGTGFLIAPQLVLTCYHVVDSCIGEKKRSKISVFFDFGTEDSPAGEVQVDAKWDIPRAKYSEKDLYDSTDDPEGDELDFALLKLKDPVGNTRGSYLVDPEVELPDKGTPILIGGHPGPMAPLQSMKFSMAAPGFEGTNLNGTRLVYKTSTLKGSSGSPVFDRSLRLIGLHHNRGTIKGKTYQNNRGIPIAKICEFLKHSKWKDVDEIEELTELKTERMEKNPPGKGNGVDSGDADSESFGEQGGISSAAKTGQSTPRQSTPWDRRKLAYGVGMFVVVVAILAVSIVVIVNWRNQRSKHQAIEHQNQWGKLDVLANEFLNDEQVRDGIMRALNLAQILERLPDDLLTELERLESQYKTAYAYMIAAEIAERSESTRDRDASGYHERARAAAERAKSTIDRIRQQSINSGVPADEGYLQPKQDVLVHIICGARIFTATADGSLNDQFRIEVRKLWESSVSDSYRESAMLEPADKVNRIYAETAP